MEGSESTRHSPFAIRGEAAQRAAVAAAARSWIGTPYHHAADVKGKNGGVDCAMLIVRVYCDLGLIEPFDPRPYTRDWMLHRDEERYLGFLLARARLVREPHLGDVVLFRVGRCYAHGGIVTRPDPLTIVHAFAPARMVTEDVVARSELSARLSQAKFASYWAPEIGSRKSEIGRAPSVTVSGLPTSDF